MLSTCAKTIPVLLAMFVLAPFVQAQQPISSFERGRALDMLSTISSDVKKHYYDPKFHGVEFEAKVADAKQQIEKSTSFNMAMSHIAAALDTLNDSHTFFLPPEHSYQHTYGMQYQIIGNRCSVTQVRPQSDAAARGAKPGDQWLPGNRDDLWKLQYVFTALRPQPGLRLTLQDPTGAQRQVDVAAKIRETKLVTDLTGEGGASDIWDLVLQEETQEHLMRAQSIEYGDKITVIKVPEFNFTALE